MVAGDTGRSFGAGRTGWGTRSPLECQEKKNKEKFVGCCFVFDLQRAAGDLNELVFLFCTVELMLDFSMHA